MVTQYSGQVNKITLYPVSLTAIFILCIMPQSTIPVVFLHFQYTPSLHLLYISYILSPL